MIFFNIFQVENLFGLLKRRFPCLSRLLRLKMRTSLAIIVAASVVHNMCVKEGIPLPGLEDERQIRQV